MKYVGFFSPLPCFLPLFPSPLCSMFRLHRATTFTSDSVNQYLGKWQRWKGVVHGVLLFASLMEYEILAIVNVSPTSKHRVLSQEPSNPEGCCMGFLCLSSSLWVRRISCCLLDSCWRTSTPNSDI